MLDALVAKENKATSGTSGSLASSPQPKRRLVCIGNYPEGDKDVGDFATVGKQTEENQHDGVTLPPSPLIVHPLR